MAVFENSRYEAALPLVLVADAEGVVRPTLYPAQTFDTSSALSYGYYLTKAGDRFDLLAAELLESAEFWWAIAALNPEIADPFSLTPGSVIRVPKR